jgi:hypothetical protein
MATARDRYMNGTYTSRRDVRREEWLDADEADTEDLTTNNDDE